MPTNAAPKSPGSCTTITSPQTSILHQLTLPPAQRLASTEYELLLVAGPELLSKIYDPTDHTKGAIVEDGIKWVLVLRHSATRVCSWYSTSRGAEGELPYVRRIMDKEFPTGLFKKSECYQVGVIHIQDIDYFNRLFQNVQPMSSGGFILKVLQKLADDGKIEQLGEMQVEELKESRETNYAVNYGPGHNTIDAIDYVDLANSFPR